MTNNKENNSTSTKKKSDGAPLTFYLKIMHYGGDPKGRMAFSMAYGLVEQIQFLIKPHAKPLSSLVE